MSNASPSPSGRTGRTAPPVRSRTLPSRTRLQNVGLVLGLLGLILPPLLGVPGLSPEGERMFGIFLLAIAWWVTEAIPLTATAVAIILLQVLTISSGALLPTAADAPPATDFFGALANPVIILFLGGFMIADGASAYGLDRSLAGVFLRPFAGDARRTVLGLMIITATLSLFMSNTATTATMFAVVLPILGALKDARARTGVALSIPLAANLGGLGTPVASPPNAIAVSALAEQGIHVSFLQWMSLAIPPMLLLLVGSWFFLSARYIPKGSTVDLEIDATFDRSLPAVLFYVIAGGTILLWFTEPLHGIPSTTVGFIPVVLLLATSVMTGRDVKALDWPVLWLVAGGIALGTGIGATGVDTWLLGSVEWDALSSTLLVLALAGVTMAVANFISNSASANLFIPMVVALASTIDTDILLVVMVVTFACSFGISMPISTPPNAIAYATGDVPTKEMAIVGLTVGIGATLLVALVLPPIWTGLGLL